MSHQSLGTSASVQGTLLAFSALNQQSTFFHCFGPDDPPVKKTQHRARQGVSYARNLYGCTSLIILAEVRGNDRGTSVNFRGCCRRVPWKLTDFHGKGHSSWHFHGKCYGCGHGTCCGSVRGTFRRTIHRKSRKFAASATTTRSSARTSAAIATAVSADVQPQQFPRPSAAVRGRCHSNPSIVIHIT